MRGNEIQQYAKQVVVKKIAPNVTVAVAQKSGFVFKAKVGKKQKLFDIASVTKMVFTTPMYVKAVGDGHVKLSDPVDKYLPFFKKHPIGKIKIIKLLNQTSGLIWWRPFYKRLNKYPAAERKYIMVKEFFKEKPHGAKVEYSDLNFILLGWILESVYQMPLDLIFKKHIARPLGLKNTKFNTGKVNDQNCLALGGVTGHAGLFSNIDDMIKIGAEFLNALEGRSKLGMKKNVLKKFAKTSVKGWGLGFMKPSKPISTGGRNISLNSFGFPGFTGPSLWIDMKRKGFAVVLATRKNPSHKNKKFAPYRVLLNDLLWEIMDEETGKK